ncbi:hypothetical protein E2C01_059127 [Portunus trituberculatus]|uniref:Uncharacterized protein n=1 Tax=Portunus trituberculatus TaxID=210409 RepID=A0A5B7H882_PORTR|nr:hypothetical protein [Portunus trituberculatus]
MNDSQYALQSPLPNPSAGSLPSEGKLPPLTHSLAPHSSTHIFELPPHPHLSLKRPAAAAAPPAPTPAPQTCHTAHCLPCVAAALRSRLASLTPCRARKTETRCKTNQSSLSKRGGGRQATGSDTQRRPWEDECLGGKRRLLARRRVVYRPTLTAICREPLR